MEEDFLKFFFNFKPLGAIDPQGRSQFGPHGRDWQDFNEDQ